MWGDQRGGEYLIWSRLEGLGQWLLQWPERCTAVSRAGTGRRTSKWRKVCAILKFRASTASLEWWAGERWKQRRLVRWAGAGLHRARQAGVRCWDSILRARWEAIKSNVRFYILSRKRYDWGMFIRARLVWWKIYHPWSQICLGSEPSSASYSLGLTGNVPEPLWPQLPHL